MRQWVWLAVAFCFSQNLLALKTIENMNSEKPLLTFHLEPARPKVGEKVSLFIQVGTGLTKNELVLEAILDGVPVILTNTAGELWSVNFNTFSEVKSHQMNVNISARDTKESNRIRSAMNQLSLEIRDLNTLIVTEPDPAKKASLEVQRDQKQNYKDELESSLDRLKTFLKSENYEFSIQADPNNTNYPYLLSIVPNTTPLNKRIRAVIYGSNFAANPHVKIESQNASVISATNTSIEILTPDFSVLGAKNIEVIFPATASEPKKNTTLGSSFFVSDSEIKL